MTIPTLGSQVSVILTDVTSQLTFEVGVLVVLQPNNLILLLYMEPRNHGTMEPQNHATIVPPVWGPLSITGPQFEGTRLVTRTVTLDRHVPFSYLGYLCVSDYCLIIS